MDEHLADVRRYDALADAGVVKRIVEHLWSMPQDREARLVACADDGELRRVRESWCRKSLGAEDPAAIERAVSLVCETMDRDRMKRRATFYYLCAKHLRKVEAI